MDCLFSCNCCSVRNPAGTAHCVNAIKQVPPCAEPVARQPPQPYPDPPPDPPAECCGAECTCEDAWIRVMIHLALFLYSFCFYIQHCASKIIAEEVKVNKSTCSTLVFIVNVITMLSCLPYGRYGDLFCSCRALKAAYMACIVSYVMTLSSWAPFMFYASRFLCIMFHCHLGTQMLLTENSCDYHRTMVLSVLGFIYRLGGILGDLFGPRVVTFSGPRNAVFLALLGSMISYLIIIRMIQCRRRRQELEIGSTLEMLGQVSAPVYFWGLLRSNGIWLFVVMKFVSQAPVIALYVILRFVLLDYYSLDDEQSFEVENYITTIDLSMHALSVAVIYVLQSDILIIKGALMAMTGAFIIMYYMEEINTFIGAMGVLMCANAVLSMTLSSVCTKLVPPCESGAVLGLNMMVFLLAMQGVPFMFTVTTLEASEQMARKIALNGAISSASTCCLFIFIAKMRRRDE